MRAHVLCIPCTVRAAYNIARRATDSEDVQARALAEVLKWLSREAEKLTTITPAALHTGAFRIVQSISGNDDPYRNLKKTSNRIAMRLEPVLRREVSRRAPREAFKVAALGAVCGNSIDFEVEGYHTQIDGLEASLLSCLRSGLTIDDTDRLMEAVSRSKMILYLLDNAGEIVFDKIFIEVITENYPVRVTAAVKSGPILNDATIEDALEVGLDECAEVITTGSKSIGLDLNEVSEEFMRKLREADLIIAKGQGYYESLTELEAALGKPIAYMLRAKCPVVSASLKVAQGSNVIKFSEQGRCAAP